VLWSESEAHCWCLLAVKSSNIVQQPMSRPVPQMSRPSRSPAASGDAVQNRIDDITAQVRTISLLSQYSLLSLFSSLLSDIWIWLQFKLYTLKVQFLFSV